ncbi:MAG: hypothetical protein M1836_008029 [Candelina mexicana]|nr:MAG: hypothetical protein M1836_008029 [Candelina mexicana]
MDLSKILNPEPDTQSLLRRTETSQTLDSVLNISSSPRHPSTEAPHGSRLPASLAEELRFIAILRYHGRNLTWRQITDCYSDHFNKPALGEYVLRDRLSTIESPGWTLHNVLTCDNGRMPQRYWPELNGIIRKYGDGLPMVVNATATPPPSTPNSVPRPLVVHSQRRKASTAKPHPQPAKRTASPEPTPKFRLIKPKPTAEEMRFVTALRFCSRYDRPSWSWITQCYATHFKKSISSSDLLQAWYTHRTKDDGFYNYITENGGRIPPRLEDEDGQQMPSKPVISSQSEIGAYQNTTLLVHEGLAPAERLNFYLYSQIFSCNEKMNRFISILHHCIADMDWNSISRCFNLRFAPELERRTPGRRPAMETMRQFWRENQEKHGSFYRNLTDHNLIQPEHEKEANEILARYGKDPTEITRPHVLVQL